PTGVSATPGDTSALVSWSAPGSNGGSTITGYTVTAVDSTTPANGHETCTWTTGPLSCTVSGLTNGDSYTFTVTATNGAGTGPASSASSAVVPAGVPSKPTGVSAAAGDTSALVTWNAPASNGGSTITGYTVTAADSTTPANGNETCTWTTGPLSCTVSGLTNGDSYTFTVTATNGTGTGPASSPSSAVVPATTPGQPTSVSATPGDTTALVTWNAPASNGGSTITGYTVTAADSTTPANGNETCTWTTGPLSCTVSGLTNGDSYTFTVTATNGTGTGPASSPSSAVVPATTPGQPTSVSATPGIASAIVTWSAPASDGGSTITGYTVTAADSTTPANGNETCTWTTGPLTCTVSGLTTGDSYTFTVTATNGTGTGPASSPSSTIVAASVHLLTGGSNGFNSPSAFAPVGGDILTWIKTLSDAHMFKVSSGSSFDGTSRVGRLLVRYSVTGFPSF
ncbi:MAG TPA: fibronectin type III domain-containing protein, partial [Acidimicrobiales bacterium]|nr:fibronectin type III domain-containing protein [Acidimicrobiales bacterium]